MKVQDLKLETLIPYARNPRKNDGAVDKVAASIKEFGWRSPIVVDEEMVILAGHTRYKAAKKLGLTEAPVHIAEGLTEAQKKAYRIADNRVAEEAEWDYDFLKIELADLDGLEDLTGFDAEELDKILTPEPTEGLTDEDAVPEVQDEPISKEGDIWILGRHRLMCGDSTSIDAVEKLMDGKKADFCFTSPPYNLGKSVGLRNGARKGADSAYNDFSDDGEWANLMRGFMSNAIIFADVSCVNVQMLSGNKFDLLKLFDEYAGHTIDLAVWSKSNPQPAMADGVMTSAFEFMWFLSSEENPNRRIKTASFQRGTFSNVFEHATASGHDASVHGAVFPLPVAEHFIQNCSQKNAVAIDFFGGTGTTLIACEKTNRDCRIMELDPKYVDVIIRRWQDFTGQAAIHEETGVPFNEMAIQEAA